MHEHLRNIATLVNQGQQYVLILLLATKGSTPREPGAKMLVSSHASYGTIGGGELEYQSIELARNMLHNGLQNQPRQYLHTFALGADMGQCCGGVCTLYLEMLPLDAHDWLQDLMHKCNHSPCLLLTPYKTAAGESLHKTVLCENEIRGFCSANPKGILLQDPLLELLNTKNPLPTLIYNQDQNDTPDYLLEYYDPEYFQLFVFGAGHVAKAVVQVMSVLSGKIFWVDERADIFPETLPQNVRKIVSTGYADIIARAPANALFLVMTHSHALDFSLCARVLKRDDFAYLGLIGSKIKRLRFEKRLLQQGYSEYSLQRLTCPIGMSGISGKQPGEIAVAVAAQIQQLRQGMRPTGDTLNAELLLTE